MAWVEWLGSIDYAGADDWRLPATIDTGVAGCQSAYVGTDCGYNVDTSTGELAYMHHDILGNESYYNPDGSRNSTGCPSTDPYCVQNTSADGVDILNLQSSVYWSGTEYAPSPGNAWNFDTSYGLQLGYYDKGSQYRGWAVRPGQVAAAPLPGTAVLMALGLMGLRARRSGRRATLGLR